MFCNNFMKSVELQEVGNIDVNDDSRFVPIKKGILAMVLVRP